MKEKKKEEKRKLVSKRGNGRDREQEEKGALKGEGQ